MATPTDDNKKKAPTKKTTNTKSSAKKSPTKKVTAQQAVASTEKAVDSAVEKVTQKAAAHVSPDLQEKATKFAHQADHFAGEVEKFGDKVGDVADSILPPSKWTYGSYDAEYHAHVSRLFIFRFLWTIIQWPVIFIWSIWYCLVSIVHYVTMFLTGKRNKDLRERQARFRRHVIAWKSYMNAITDKRPPILVD